MSSLFMLPAKKPEVSMIAEFLMTIIGLAVFALVGGKLFSPSDQPDTEREPEQPSQGVVHVSNDGDGGVLGIILSVLGIILQIAMG